MISVVIHSTGQTRTLQIEERAQPRPGHGELLIRVVAAGVNRPDIAQRKGHYPAPPWAPQDVPGLEVSGIVVEVGPDCIRFQPGQPVCALLSGGGYAEYVVANQFHVLPIPEGWTLEEAAGFPETTFTVWQNLFELAHLRPTESLLVHGGTSGIGITAIQLAKAFGCMVLVTCGTSDKCAKCLQLGADHAIHYREQPFVEAVDQLTHGKGVDVILDMVGGPYLENNLRSLSMDGRLALINFMGGSDANLSLAQMIRKRLTMTGSTLRNRSDAYKARLCEMVESQVYPLTATGKYRPVIDSVFDLSDALLAHQRLEQSLHMGKILLRTNFPG